MQQKNNNGYGELSITAKAGCLHGSDIRAESAAAILTLIATFRVHGIETRQYYACEERTYAG